MSVLDDFRMYLSLLKKVKFMDFISSYQYNILFKLIRMLNELYPCDLAKEFASKLPEKVNSHNIIEPEHHNNVVYAIKAFRDCIYKYTNTEKLDNDIYKLRTVNYGDYILCDDFNNVIDCLNDIISLMPIVSKIWIAEQRDFRRTGFYPISAKYMFACNSNKYLYMYRTDGLKLYVLWIGNASDTQPVVTKDKYIYCSSGVNTPPTLLNKFDFNGNNLFTKTLNGFNAGTPSIDNDGNIIVVDNRTYVHKFDKYGNELFSINIGLGLTFPANITTVIDKENNIYVGNHWNKMYCIDENGSIVWEKTLWNYGNFITYDDKNEQIYIVGITTYLNDTVFCLNLDGDILWKYYVANAKFNGISVDKDGTVYIAGNNLKKVFKFSPDGTLIDSVSFTDNVGNYVSIDDNYIYVYCLDGNVYKLTKELEPVWSVGVGKLSKRNISVDGDGNVYTFFGDGKDAICKINSDGEIEYITNSIGFAFGNGIALF